MSRSFIGGPSRSLLTSTDTESTVHTGATNNLNLRIKTEPATAGKGSNWRCPDFVGIFEYLTHKPDTSRCICSNQDRLDFCVVLDYCIFGFWVI